MKKINEKRKFLEFYFQDSIYPKNNEEVNLLFKKNFNKIDWNAFKITEDFLENMKVIDHSFYYRGKGSNYDMQKVEYKGNIYLYIKPENKTIKC